VDDPGAADRDPVASAPTTEPSLRKGSTVSQRRTLILIAAIAIGALASFLVWNYVGGIQDQAYDDAEQVKVFVVKQTVAQGTPGNVAAASIVEENIPRKFKPANAIESLDDIAGQVARTDLVSNSVVVGDMFVAATDPEAVSSFSDQLTKIQNKDMTTYTIQIDPVRGAAGVIAPGDYVNILVKGANEATGGGAGADDADGGEGAPATVTQEQARYLYQKVQVLWVGTTSVEQANTAAEGTEATPAPVGSGLITFILPVEATQVMASIPPESLYLSLVSKDYEPTPTASIDISPLPAEEPNLLTPYGPSGARGEG
jgi:Flp pilus assembly protein CpaB